MLIEAFGQAFDAMTVAAFLASHVMEVWR